MFQRLFTGLVVNVATFGTKFRDDGDDCLEPTESGLALTVSRHADQAEAVDVILAGCAKIDRMVA